MFSRSVASDSLVTPWASLSVGFPRQEYWVGCHFLLQRIFLSQELNSSPALAGGFFTAESPGKPSLNSSSPIKQSPSSSSGDTYANSLTRLFELFGRNQDSYPGGRWWLHADHKHTDPRLVGTSRLMNEITKTSPRYLNAKQSEQSPQAATLRPNVSFKNPSLKAIREFRTFAPSCLFLLGTLQ